MNQKLAFSLFLGLTLSQVQAIAYFQQKEMLVFRDDTRFHLVPYFTYRPKIFGLVSDKDKSWVTGGYICLAKNFEEFLTECDNRVPEQDWVRSFSSF